MEEQDILFVNDFLSMIECNEECIAYVNNQIKKYQLKQYKKGK